MEEDNLVKPSTTYGFVRARQLEGTLPGDPGTGTWILSAMRVFRGWGFVAETDWPRAGGWPPREPPGLDEKAKENRVSAYRRIRTLREAKAILTLARNKGIGFLAAFNIVTNDWYQAKGGVIPMPNSSSMFDNAHAVHITKFSDEQQQFYFWNSWGPAWGDNGFGYLPYQYFSEHMTDAWVMYPTQDQYPTEWNSPFIVLEWGRSYFGDVLLHGIEIYELATRERIGWCFARCMDGSLDVEEFFVRPNFRRCGHAKRIRSSLLRLAARLNLPLRMWIGHPDVAHLEAIQRLVAPIPLKLQPSSVKWASYVAIDPATGSSEQPKLDHRIPPQALAPPMPLPSATQADTVTVPKSPITN